MHMSYVEHMAFKMSMNIIALKRAKSAAIIYKLFHLSKQAVEMFVLTLSHHVHALAGMQFFQLNIP